MARMQDGEPEQGSLDSRDLELQQLRAEVTGLNALVRQMLAQGNGVPQSIPEPAPLESRENERERILAAWQREPRVKIFIAPDDNDRRAAAALVAKGLPSEFPPMIFQVNGVQLAVPKGKSTEVPESIAALYEYTLDPWSSRGIVKPITFDEAEIRAGLA